MLNITAGWLHSTEMELKIRPRIDIRSSGRQGAYDHTCRYLSMVWTATRYAVAGVAPRVALLTNAAVWLAFLIFGRDLGLSISAFYFRYISLPPPVGSEIPSRLQRESYRVQRTLTRYFDPTIPSAEVKPTQISKVRLCRRKSDLGHV